MLETRVKPQLLRLIQMYTVRLNVVCCYTCWFPHDQCECPGAGFGQSAHDYHRPWTHPTSIASSTTTTTPGTFTAPPATTGLQTAQAVPLCAGVISHSSHPSLDPNLGISQPVAPPPGMTPPPWLTSQVSYPSTPQPPPALMSMNLGPARQASPCSSASAASATGSSTPAYPYPAASVRLPLMSDVIRQYLPSTQQQRTATPYQQQVANPVKSVPKQQATPTGEQGATTQSKGTPPPQHGGGDAPYSGRGSRMGPPSTPRQPRGRGTPRGTMRGSASYRNSGSYRNLVFTRGSAPTRGLSGRGRGQSPAHAAASSPQASAQASGGAEVQRRKSTGWKGEVRAILRRFLPTNLTEQELEDKIEPVVQAMAEDYAGWFLQRDDNPFMFTGYLAQLWQRVHGSLRPGLYGDMLWVRPRSWFHGRIIELGRLNQVPHLQGTQPPAKWSTDMPPSMHSADGQRSRYYRVRDRIAAELQRYSVAIRQNPTALGALWDIYRLLVALDESLSRCVRELSQMEVLMKCCESVIRPAFDLPPPPAEGDIPPRPPRPTPQSTGVATHRGQREAPQPFPEEQEMDVTISPTSEEVAEGNRRKDAFLRWYNNLSDPPAFTIQSAPEESPESTDQTQSTSVPPVESDTQDQTIPLSIVRPLTQAQTQIAETRTESISQTPTVPASSSTSSTLQPPANLPAQASTSRVLASAAIGGARPKTSTTGSKPQPPKDKRKNASKRSASKRDYHSDLEDEPPFLLSGDKRRRVANEQLHQAAWESPYRGKPELTLAFEARHPADGAREWQQLTNLTVMMIHEFLIKCSVSGEATCRPEVQQYLSNIMPSVTDYLPAHVNEGNPDVRGMDYGYTLWVATWLMQLDMHVAFREEAPFRTSLSEQRSGSYMELFLATGLASISLEDIRQRSRRDCYNRCLQEQVNLERRMAINQRALETREVELRAREAELGQIDPNDPVADALVQTSKLAIEAASDRLNTAVDARDHLRDQSLFLNEQIQIFRQEVEARSPPTRPPLSLPSASQGTPDVETTPAVAVEVPSCSPIPVTDTPPTEAVVTQAVVASSNLSWEEQVQQESALRAQSLPATTDEEVRSYDFQAFQMLVPSADETPSAQEGADEVLNMETGPEHDVPLSQEDNILTGEGSQVQGFPTDLASTDGPSPGVAGPLSELGLDEDDDLLDYDEENQVKTVETESETVQEETEEGTEPSEDQGDSNL